MGVTYMTWLLGPCVEEIEDVTIVKAEIFHGESDRHKLEEEREEEGEKSPLALFAI